MTLAFGGWPDILDSQRKAFFCGIFWALVTGRKSKFGRQLVSRFFPGASPQADASRFVRGGQPRARASDWPTTKSHTPPTRPRTKPGLYSMT